MIEYLSAAVAASSSFDPEAATRAYLDTLQGAARAKSDAYFEGGYWLLLWGALLSVLVNWLVLRLGWSAAWSRWSGRVTRRRWLQPALYALPYFLITALIALPWSIYTGFLRERQYDLMNLSFGGWLGEQAIGLVISIIFGAIVLMLLFAGIRRAPRTWWLWGTGVLAALIALAMVISPVFISPLFNAYHPMPEGPLKDQIMAMARDHDVPAENIYVFDQSKQHKRISANVSGLGPTIRISLNDNLLNRSTPAEVKAVMGHELGHYVLGHIARSITVFIILFLAGLFLLWWLSPRLLARHGTRWGVRDIADPAVVPLFAIIFTLYFLACTPITNSLVRINESEADAFGLEAAREPDGFASIAMKLSEYRKIEPHPLEEIIFFDHPSGRTRVRMAMDWKARHLADARQHEEAAPPVE